MLSSEILLIRYDTGNEVMIRALSKPLRTSRPGSTETLVHYGKLPVARNLQTAPSAKSVSF